MHEGLHLRTAGDQLDESVASLLAVKVLAERLVWSEQT
ncbi:Uncharacterised protein [Klebsiella pneumoniae]|jgi:hypothetical protein|nr:Uncharacterised protein [Klebsiella pneumoniae]